MTKEHVICLNPHCSQLLERYSVTQGEEGVKGVPLAHEKCKGWMQTISGKSQQGKLASEHEARQSIDLFSEPVKGIEWLSLFSSGPWKSQVSEYFGQIKERLDLMLSRVYSSCVEKIEVFLAANQVLSSSISDMCAKMDEPSFDSLLFYNQKIRQGLLQTAQTGILTILNPVCMQRQIEQVEKEMGNLCQHIWQEQDRFILQKKMSHIKHNQQIKKWLDETDGQIINNYLVSIHGALKLKNCKYEQERGIRCGLCKWESKGSGERRQARQSKARSEMFHHLCTKHSDPIVDAYFVPREKSAYQVTFQQVMRDIRALSHGTFILIDRQNTKQTGSLKSEQNQGAYILEVVSQHCRTIPQGRYLVARSKAKDAADTLIMMILYEVTRRTEVPAVLVTRDHFGTTLQGILKQIGFNFELRAELSSGSMSISNQSLNNMSLDSGFLLGQWGNQ